MRRLSHPGFDTGKFRHRQVGETRTLARFAGIEFGVKFEGMVSCSCRVGGWLDLPGLDHDLVSEP